MKHNCKHVKQFQEGEGHHSLDLKVPNWEVLTKGTRKPREGNWGRDKKNLRENVVIYKRFKSKISFFSVAASENTPACIQLRMTCSHVPHGGSQRLAENAASGDPCGGGTRQRKDLPCNSEKGSVLTAHFQAAPFRLPRTTLNFDPPTYQRDACCTNYPCTGMRLPSPEAWIGDYWNRGWNPNLLAPSLRLTVICYIAFCYRYR